MLVIVEMNTEALKDVIKQELPGLLREDPALRAYILELTRPEYADRAETQDRFYDILAELRRDRDEQNRKWDEPNQHSDSDEVETLCGVNLIKLETQINRPASDIEAANGHD